MKLKLTEKQIEIISLLQRDGWLLISYYDHTEYYVRYYLQRNGVKIRNANGRTIRKLFDEKILDDKNRKFDRIQKCEYQLTEYGKSLKFN